MDPEIGRELVAIRTEGDYEEPNFTAYLEGLSDRLFAEDAATWITRATLQGYYEGAKLEAQILSGRMPKAYKKYFQDAAPATQHRMSAAVQQEIKNAPTPINEATAFKMLCENGYFDISEPPTMAHAMEVTRERARKFSPERLAEALESRMRYLIELVGTHTTKELREAYEYANVIRAAKRLRKLTDSILGD